MRLLFADAYFCVSKITNQAYAMAKDGEFANAFAVVAVVLIACGAFYAFAVWGG